MIDVHAHWKPAKLIDACAPHQGTARRAQSGTAQKC